ncbi:amidohydrolase [Corynebacterium choanae]|uniref:amidohydrolase n=1 Tax=Corynebacterium choanae TaxID=1862358 RepID=UPI000F5023EB|nr:amidohydrolase [Corynebacterium choanae]
MHTRRTHVAELVQHHRADLSFQQACYQWLHAHPELSGQEANTAATIAEYLERFDCEITRNIGGHGLVAVFRNGKGPTVLFRADFDGLPVEEITGVPFASQEVAIGKDGNPTKVMHACGHDMHTTAALGACAILDEHRADWHGTVVMLFQPAEEDSTGAAAMVADGLQDIIPAPDVCLGQHIVPGPAGQVMTMPGAALAACDSVTITIFGQSAHGSMPHHSIDPTVVAAMIILRLQTIVAREISPEDFAVISVGTLQSGHTNNTIPGTATLTLNCRFYDDAVKATVYAAIERVVRAECVASGCVQEPTFSWFAHGELTDNDETVFSAVRPVFDALFGQDSVTATRWTASEDFPFIPQAFGAPYLFWTVGVTPRPQWHAAAAQGQLEQVIPGNHMGTFLPDYEPSVQACTQAAAAAILTYVANPQ